MKILLTMMSITILLLTYQVINLNNDINRFDTYRAEEVVDYMDKNFNDMLKHYNARSLYSISIYDRKEWLEKHDDLWCNEPLQISKDSNGVVEPLCCGGNSIGWYECF